MIMLLMSNPFRLQAATPPTEPQAKNHLPASLTLIRLYSIQTT